MLDIEVCSSKIIQNSKYIEYFLHDILDYSLLNKQDNQFCKNSDIFDIRQAIQELNNIQEDSIILKEIKFDV